MREKLEVIGGALIGTVLGDALGLPFEGLSRRRVGRRLGDRPLRPSLVCGRGLMSDDGEHAAMTAQALIVAGDDPARFARRLGWSLRFWLLGLPAGIGLGTLRAIGRLWLGFPPDRSGVRSAGNGPLMRAPILGAALADRPEELAERFVVASSRLTHSDRRAVEGAVVVARLARVFALGEEVDFDRWVAGLESTEIVEVVRRVESGLERGEASVEFADALGLERGVGGFVLHTLPVVLLLALRSRDDLRAAVEEAVRLGGDSDTTAAIVGGLVGAAVGRERLPVDWIDRMVDFPRSISWLDRVAERLAEGGGRPLRLAWPLVAVRNGLFLLVVLAHGLRRLVPF